MDVTVGPEVSATLVATFTMPMDSVVVCGLPSPSETVRLWSPAKDRLRMLLQLSVSKNTDVSKGCVHGVEMGPLSVVLTCTESVDDKGLGTMQQADVA